VSKPDRQTKVLITNSVALNGGDAAILLSMTDALKKSMGDDVYITVQAKNSEACRKYYPEIDFIPGLEDKERGRSLSEKIFFRLRYPRLCMYALIQRYFGIAPGFMVSVREREIMRSFRDCDMVISCGGGFLNDLYPILPRTLGFIIAWIYGQKTAIFAQSVGPFTGWFSKMQAKWIIDRCSSVTVRDEESLHIIKDELKCQNREISFTADSAWLLQPMEGINPEENPVLRIKKQHPGCPVVGISARKWDFPEVSDEKKRIELINRYKNIMKDLCIHLVKQHDSVIVFISTCQGRPEYYTDDSVFAEDLVKDLPEDVRARIYIIKEAFDPRILTGIMKEFEFFAGVRMHTVILALLAGIPCVGIGYEFKTVELFRQMELENYAFSLYSDNLTGINELVSNVSKNISQLKGFVNAKTGEMKLRAGRNIDCLIRALKNEQLKRQEK
jgi:colanic acid/amylovoran biosynthesis protein